MPPFPAPVTGHTRRPAVLLAVISAAFALSVTAAEKRAPSSDRWEKVIQSFEAADQADPPAKNAILLVGGSNARRWTNVGDYFPGHKVINRGFGGAQLSDVVQYIDRIVVPYAPKTIFLNAGGNDLSAGKSPEQVRDACQAFVAKVSASLPEAHVFYIAIPPVLKAAKAPETMAVIRRTNSLIEELSRTDNRLHFVNLFPRFLDDQGQPRAELFVSDGTHFSAKGCEVVAALMRKAAGIKTN